jgi:hypothetical protein
MSLKNTNVTTPLEQEVPMDTAKGLLEVFKEATNLRRSLRSFLNNNSDKGLGNTNVTKPLKQVPRDIVKGLLLNSSKQQQTMLDHSSPKLVGSSGPQIYG